MWIGDMDGNYWSISKVFKFRNWIILYRPGPLVHDVFLYFIYTESTDGHK